MTATYTNQPGTRAIDTVRFEIDDKDCTPETDAALSDEEIQYLIDTNSHILLAAASAADTIAALHADGISKKSVGDLNIEYGDGGRAVQYAAMAQTLRRRAARKASGYAGGISHDDKKAMRDDTDRVEPSFELGIHDNLGDAVNSGVRGVIEY